MSGIINALLATAGFRVLSESFLSEVFTVATAPQVSFASDGTTIYRDLDGNNAAGVNWGSPTTVGAGAGYYLMAVYSSGTTTGTSNGAATPTLMSSTINIGRNATTPGNAVTTIFTYQIATDVGMTNVVGSGTITVSSDRT